MSEQIKLNVLKQLHILKNNNANKSPRPLSIPDHDEKQGKKLFELQDFDELVKQEKDEEKEEEKEEQMEEEESEQNSKSGESESKSEGQKMEEEGEEEEEEDDLSQKPIRSSVIKMAGSENKGGQLIMPGEMQTLGDKLKSILKTFDAPKTKKKIKFEDEIDKRINIDGCRKWNEKLKNPKKGRFQPLQEKQLMKSLNEHMKDLNLSLDQVVRGFSEDDDKIPKNLHLWTKVCSVLPDRYLTSSYKFMKRLLCTKNNNGPWTEEETDQLLSHIEKHGRKWSLIAQKMNRTAENIRDRYRTLGEENNEEIQKQFWSIEQLYKFLKYLQKYSHVSFLNPSIQEQLQKASEHDQIEKSQMLKKKYNSKSFTFHNNEIVRKYMEDSYRSIKMQEVNWKKISDKIGSKTIFDCRNKFVQLLQLQIRGGLMSKEKVEREIVSFILEQNVKNEKDIQWKKWRNRYEMTSEQIKNRWMVLKKHIEGRGRKEFKEILGELKDRLQK